MSEQRERTAPGTWSLDVEADGNYRGSIIRGSKGEAIARMPFWRDDDPLAELEANARFIVLVDHHFDALERALKAASHALHAYEYGNSAPALAKEVAKECDKVLIAIDAERSKP